MDAPLHNPEGTYAARVTVYAPLAPDGAVWRRHEVAAGLPLPGPVVGAEGDELPDGPAEYLVALPGVLSLRLRLRSDGLTVRDLRVEAPGAVTVTARVSALAGAPEWLPDQADYAVFQGDRKAAAGLRHIWLPLCREQVPAAPTDVVAVDRLVTALGQAIHRANARLAQQSGSGGTALAASVTVRVAVTEFGISEGNRVLLGLPRRGEPASQHLEVTMTTVPGAEAPDSDA